MDIFGLDYNMNGMAPRGMVAYQTPPYGIIPPHSAALVVIPNGVGGLLQYGWFTGACCRILNQDSVQVEQIFREGELEPPVHEPILRHLSAACGASTPELYHQRCQIGATILSYYQAVSIEDQIFWLRHDAEVRRSNMADYYQPRYSASQKAFAEESRSPSPDPRKLDAHAREIVALMELRTINKTQLEHIQGVMVGLLSLLPKDRAAQIADICEINVPSPQENTTIRPQNNSTTAPPPPPIRQPSATNIPSVQNTTSMPPTQQRPSAPVTARQPLAPVSANVQSPAPVQQSKDLKRKRPDPAPKKMSEVIDLLEDSEDEDALQSQVDALQANIAAIRQRTAHEDQVVPSKKAKTTGKPNTSAAATTAAPGSKPVASTPSPFQADPFAPPRSSQNDSVSRVVQTSIAVPGTGVAKPLMPTGMREEQRRLRESMLASLAGHAPTAPKPARTPVAPPTPRKATPRSGLKKSDGRPLAQQLKSIADEEFWEKQYREQFLVKQGSSAPTPRAVVDLTASSPPAKLTQAQAIGRSQPGSGDKPGSEDQSVPRDQPVLCKEQQEVVDCILAGHNVFYTGSAGCGKSTVLKTFVPLLREKGKTVRIVAPTGKAALDINGSTTWTFAGWTPLHMKRSLKQLLKDAHGKFVRGRLCRTDVLVIDEISMVENHLFARLSAIMKEAREDPRAFGGVQLIVTGDFCQLPPVKPFQYCMFCGREQHQLIVDKDKIVYRCPVHGDCSDEDKWAFRSAAWEECNFRHINLTNIHRQSDEVFIRVLQKLRIGTALTETDRRLLLDHPCDITNAVKLFPTREQVKRINQTEFDRLTSVKHSYTCLDLFSWNKEKHPHLESKGNRSPYDDSLDALREHRLDIFVEYKKDMLVVLLVNLDIDAGLVNGSQGRIVGFEPLDEAKLPKANRNGVGGGSKMLSSRVGSSQSSSKKWKRRESSVEPEGSDGGKGELRGEYAFLREGQIRQFIYNSRNQSKMWPIVEFDNGLKRTIYAGCQVNELGDEREYTLLARTQIPLIAAWAMTVIILYFSSLCRVELMCSCRRSIKAKA